MIIIGILLFIFSFLTLAFSEGSEMAFLACNKLKLRHHLDSGSKSAAILNLFHRDPKRLLTTLMIASNLSHVTLTAIFSYAVSAQFQIDNEWILTLILAPVVIIFAQIIPKDWFRVHADEVVYRFAPFLLWCERILFPLSIGVKLLTDFLIALTLPPVKRDPFVTKDEFRYMVDASVGKGVLHEHEKHLIHTILNLAEATVEEVMTPVREFPSLELSKSVADAKSVARTSRKPVLMVYEEIPELVVGMVYVFDLLFEENSSLGMRKFLKPPLFIPQEMSVEKAILLLQSKRMSYAVVANAQREVVGVIGIDNLIRF